MKKTAIVALVLCIFVVSIINAEEDKNMSEIPVFSFDFTKVELTIGNFAAEIVPDSEAAREIASSIVSVVFADTIFENAIPIAIGFDESKGIWAVTFSENDGLKVGGAISVYLRKSDAQVIAILGEE
jgi:hypothetical protein